MGSRIAAFDWSQTPLGPAAAWPQGLQSAVAAQLAARVGGSQRHSVAVLFDDIDERKRADLSLRESEERLGLAIEIGELASWDWDLHSNEVAWNDRHFLILGYAVGEVRPTYDAWLARVHPEDRDETLAMIGRARDTGRRYVHAFRTLHADGAVRWCSARGHFFYDTRGEPYRMIGVMEDVTERKRAELALREREADLARVQRIGRVGGLNIDVAGGLRSWRSPEYLRLHGLPEDTAQETHEDWLSRVHAGDRESAQAALFAALESGAAVYDSEYRIVRPVDGETRWIQVRADIERDAGGKPLRLVGAHVDVTAQKRAELALRRNEVWLAAERAAFQSAMNGEPLEKSLGILTATAVAQAETERRCAFYIANPEGTELTHVVGMSEEYAKDVHGFRISPDSLSCGLAVARGEPVITRDVHDEPLWQPWAWMAEKHGYRGCWSFPVEASSGRRVGSFAMYFQAPYEPTAADRRLSARLAHIAGIIISRHNETIERTRAEAALRESEERYRSLFERIDEGFCIIEMVFDGGKPVDYRFLAVNPAFERHTGIAQAQGRLMRDIAPGHEQHWFDRYGEVALTGKAQRFEAPAQALGERWYDVNTFRVGDPAQRRVAIVFSDITQRQRDAAALRDSEERQRLTVELVPALLWWADPAGKNISVNYRWKAYTGQGEGDLHDLAQLDALHPDDVDAMRAALGHSFATGEPLERQHRIRRADGEYRWHLIRHVPIRGADGAVTRWFGAAIDVQELRELQERQRVLVGELQHRTRNLMGVIRSIADRTGDASRDFADFRQRFCDRLEALARVQGLLSRLQDTDRVAFDELLRTELDAVDGAAGKVGLHGPAGVRLRSSTVQTLAMALHELATNAMKYGALSQPGGHLAISWRRVPPDRQGRPGLHIDWLESGVEMPAAGSGAQGGGQGRELIEKALPYQLKAKTSFELGPQGVHCTITIPVSASDVDVG